METLSQFLDSKTPIVIQKILWLFKLTPEDILMLLFYFIGAVLITKFFRFIKKPLKFLLYHKRADTFYRFLYYRVDIIMQPLLFLINFYLFKRVIAYIFNIKNGSDIDIFFYIINLFLALWFFYEIVKFLIYATLRKRIKTQQEARRELFNLLLNITKITILLLAIIAILSKFGVDITALITSLGIGGVIIGFSAKDTLINFFDSIRLISEDAFRQGDWIETRDIEGFVTELGLTSTKIRTFDNAMVTIPNSKIANDYIKNWSKRVIGRRIKFHLPNEAPRPKGRGIFISPGLIVLDKV